MHRVSAERRRHGDRVRRACYARLIVRSQKALVAAEVINSNTATHVLAVSSYVVLGQSYRSNFLGTAVFSGVKARTHIHTHSYARTGKGCSVVWL
ncbi:hypothetical protein NP493_19g01007 [Ridgeia piscesae]|uniref:Uncharacterized protein n=1 Tax=Ridgeia piscesae TaxID=27915 RepID=A0AAD9PE05_RIDPI|nr:hypothetical protein NP493_19g01007 [Ridgeia piscesae]